MIKRNVTLSLNLENDYDKMIYEYLCRGKNKSGQLRRIVLSWLGSVVEIKQEKNVVYEKVEERAVETKKKIKKDLSALSSF